MNLHEYQAKELLRRYRVPTPAGVAAHRPEEAKPAAGGAGSAPWVVKAQAHTGGRGKAGGVRVVNDLDALQAEATRLLGSRLVTHQTGPAGLPVSALLVEAATPVIRELYLSLLVDRTRRRVVCMVSPS
ncbi:MAG: ATP-grasp domain-containing protein, partial [Pseudomonadota bacterium]